MVGARHRLLPRRGVRRPPPVPEAGAHALADGDRPRPRALLRVAGRLLAGQIAGAALALSVHRRQRPIKLAFNLAQLSLCTGIALLVFRSLAGGGGAARLWAAVLLAVGVAHTVGVVLVSAVIAVAEAKRSAPQLHEDARRLARRRARDGLPRLAGVALADEPPPGCCCSVPRGSCVLAFRGYMQQREQREHVEFLYESMRERRARRSSASRSVSCSIAARRLLRAEYAEISCSRADADEPVLRSTSGAAGEALMHPDTLSPETNERDRAGGAAERSLLLAAPARRACSSTGSSRARARRRVVGALRGEERVFGFLLVGDRVGDVDGRSPRTNASCSRPSPATPSVLLENGRLEQSLAQVTELQEELRHQAYHDALTGLPNRVLFTERVTEARRRAPTTDNASHAVLFLDLDHFKFVNDSWGHAAGDELLVQVAERLRGAIRPGDTPARLGGDEFAVLLEDTDAADAEHVAQRIRDALAAPFSLVGPGDERPREHRHRA